ncbi:MAG TPA: glutamate ABC transporter substrate-binding protein, partial [Nocardioides sp.]|nr:glutamate ABC transporter substrate-binding protein [Nocardioides sp.]
MTTYRFRLPLAGLAALGLLSGCGYAATPVPAPSTAAEAPPTPSSCTTTTSDLRSYDPSPATDGPTFQEIRKRGALRIGVSWDTRLMSSRNAQNNRLVGFDIDLARAIAKDLHVRTDFHVITAGDRVDMLKKGQLDMVIRAFTITCDRWKDIAFSSEYYDAGQKVLVRKDLAASYHSPHDLAGLRVCAPSKTTSLANIAKVEPKAIPVQAATHTGCLMMLEQGDADAITSDDTVLAGLVDQDPYAVVPRQEPLEDEPYGVGMNADAKDLVVYVNWAIAKYERDGDWQRSYDRWLRPELHVDAT